jgi:hypothetical protein
MTSPTAFSRDLEFGVRVAIALGLSTLLPFMVATGCEESPPAKTASSEPDAVSAADEAVGSTADGPSPIVPPEESFTPVERIVITGATVLSDLHLDENGEWVALGLEDTSVLIEDGVIARLVPSSNYQLGPGDVTVTARGRWVMPAPIVRGVGTEFAGAEQWCAGGRLVDATLAGIGAVVLPREIADGPHGRCATSRLNDLEIPAATVFAADPDTLAALDGVPTLEAGSGPGTTLAAAITAAIEEGRSSAEILASLTTNPAAALGRPELGAIEPGSSGKVLVLNDNPLENPLAILEPHAVTFGNRVMRRAEIEVLRDAANRGLDMRTTVLALVPEGVESDRVRRWTLSVQAQVFGGIAAGQGVDGLHFAGRTGEPRFDATSGVLRLEPAEDLPNLELVYDGPPQSFRIQTTPNDEGLSVELAVEGGDPIDAASPGAKAPPIVDLAVDLDLRAAMLTPGESLELDLQELIYGNGPIGLAPRRYRLTVIDPESCPPCFEDFERVWRLDVIDIERGPDLVAAVAIVGMRDGRPARARFDAGADPVWFDEYPAVGRPEVD